MARLDDCGGSCSYIAAAPRRAATQPEAACLRPGPGLQRRKGPALSTLPPVEGHERRGQDLLPLPDPGYRAFRQVTQYGDESHPPVVEDVLVWLEWCRALPGAVAAGEAPGWSDADGQTGAGK